MTAALSGPTGKPKQVDDKPKKKGGDRAQLDELLSVLALPDPWTDFFVFQSYGESRWHTSAHNGSVKETRASKKSWDRNAEALLKCGFAESDYVKGSGGWGGMLYPNGAMMFKEHDNRCTDPQTIVHDPLYSLAAMVGFANGLQGWKGWRRDPTFVNTRLGWGWPGKMGNDDEYRAKRKAAYTKTLAKIGLPVSLLETEMPRLHMTADDALIRLQAGVSHG